MEQKRMSEQNSDNFRDKHATDTVQYILGLVELPSEDEFVKEHLKTCRNKHRTKKGCAKNIYEYLKINGLP